MHQTSTLQCSCWWVIIHAYFCFCWCFQDSFSRRCLQVCFIYEQLAFHLVHVVILSFHATHIHTLLMPFDFKYVNAWFDFWYTVLLIFTHCLPPSTFSMLTHDSTSGVCRFVNNRRQIIVVWVYLWTCMEKLGASHSSDSLRSKRVKYTRKEYVSTSYLRL